MLFLQHASIIIHCLLSNRALWLSGFSHRSPFSEMRRASSAQLFGEETGKSSPKMDCISLNNFQHYWWYKMVENFCDLMILWLCIDTFQRRTPKFFERISLAFPMCFVMVWYIEVGIVHDHLAFKMRFWMRWSEWWTEESVTIWFSVSFYLFLCVKSIRCYWRWIIETFIEIV